MAYVATKVSPSEYMQAVHDALAAEFPSCEVVAWEPDLYPPTMPALIVDSVDYSVGEDPMNGQVALDVSIEIHCVTEGIKKKDREGCADLAASVTAFCRMNRFGVRANPSEVIGFAPDDLENFGSLDVFRVDLIGTIFVGTDAFAPNTPSTPGADGEAWVGEAPDIGTGHESDYELVFDGGS